MTEDILGDKPQQIQVGVASKDGVGQPKWVLNPDQMKAHSWLLSFVLGKGNGYTKCLLEGYAGTGKTFTINRVVEDVRRQQPGIVFGMTAPTHKAVRQLKKHSELKDQLDFGTIHSFLGLKEVLKPHPRNPQKMVVTYEPDWSSSRELRIDGIDVLIIDESSMLRDDLYEHIDDYARSHPNLKIVFMGDGLQIPPVRSEDDPPGKNINAIPFVEAQRQSRKIYRLVLEQIVRQGMDNPIIAYATDIRTQYRNQAIQHEFKCTPSLGVEVLPRNLERLRTVFKKYFDTPEFDKDTDFVKVVAWRNDTVDYFNREIRLLINKAVTLPRIINKEKLVLNKPIVKGEKVLLANNEELEVVSHEIVTVPIKYKLIERSNMIDHAKSDGIEGIGESRSMQEFKAYRCTVVTVDERKFMIDILHEDDQLAFDDLKRKIEKCAKNCKDTFDRKEMWKQFYALDKPFANVNYNYCITAHKSQGSTYDYCISMEWDIDQNRSIGERNRIRYVAATRARNKLFIVK